jgi:lysozyme
MIDRDKLKADLRRDEGVRFDAYKDTNNFWTIGVGHLLGSSPRMSDITPEECDALLDVDINEAEHEARDIFPRFDEMSEPRQRAIVNMVFNRGPKRVRDSSTITPAILKASESGSVEDWAAITAAIAASPWAKQVGDRATRIGNVLANGFDLA